MQSCYVTPSDEVICQDYTPTIRQTYAAHYPNVSLTFNASNMNTLDFKPRAFTLGLYKISLQMTISPPDTDSNSSTYDYELENLTGYSEIYISIGSTNLVACVNNDTLTISEVWDPTINMTLDATCSYDPDVWPEQQSNLTYYWSCYRQCESAPTYTDYNFNVWNATNQYNTSCDLYYPTMRNMSFSDEGCFLPFGVHRSGPLTPHYSKEDWNSALSNNWLSGSNNSQGSKNNYFSTTLKDFWVYTTAADNSTVTLNTYSIFYKTQHYFILTVGSPSDKVSHFYIVNSYNSSNQETLIYLGMFLLLVACHASISACNS